MAQPWAILYRTAGVSKPNKNYAISRIDQPEKKNHGYYVRISHRGKSIAKYFPDKKSGGKSKALELAREFRDSQLEKLPRYKQEAASRKRQRIPQSDTTGVTHVVSKAAGGKSYNYWQAAWLDSDGKRRTAKFSISRYGKDEALAMAKKTRRDALSGRPPVRGTAKATAAAKKKAASKKKAARKRSSGRGKK